MTDGPLMTMMREQSPELYSGVIEARRLRRLSERLAAVRYRQAADPTRSVLGLEGLGVDIAADRDGVLRHRARQAEYRRAVKNDPVARLAHAFEQRVGVIEKRLAALGAA